MGRPKLTLKPIQNGRDREVALTRGKKGLVRKMSEISTTCGVNGCMIIYDGNGNAPPTTWPEDPIKLLSIIEKYERKKNEKAPKTFDLKDYFVNRNNMVQFEISKVRKEILKIKYPTWDPNFNSLGEEELRNFIAMLDIKLEACIQRREMLKHNHQFEANFNFMHNISRDQLVLAPMNPLNDGILLVSYQHNLDRGFGSQSQMLHFDPNLMQLMAKNKGVMQISDQVDMPLDCANQIGAFGNSTNQPHVPVDLTSQFADPLDCFSQFGEIEDLASQHDGVVDSATQPTSEYINWTNQHDVSMIGRSTIIIRGASNYCTNFLGLENNGDKDNIGSLLSNYNEGSAFGSSTIPPVVPSQIGEPLGCFSQHGGIENLASQFDEDVNWDSQMGESINWTTQHGVPVIGKSTTTMNGASSNYDTNFHVLEKDGGGDNLNFSLCNYNGGVQSRQPNSNDQTLQNIASLSDNVQDRATMPTLFPPMDGFQIDENNNMLQNSVIQPQN